MNFKEMVSTILLFSIFLYSLYYQNFILPLQGDEEEHPNGGMNSMSYAEKQGTRAKRKRGENCNIE